MPSLDGLPAFTDYAIKGRTYRYFPGKPLWGFGYGLSYTSFKYGPVKLSAETLKAGDPITATVTVTNAGKVAGDEVVEAYLKTPQEGGPIHSLVGFERVTLDPGASKEVTLKIDPRGRSQAWTTRATGRYSPANTRLRWAARNRRRRKQNRKRDSPLRAPRRFRNDANVLRANLPFRPHRV